MKRGLLSPWVNILSFIFFLYVQLDLWNFISVKGKAGLAFKAVWIWGMKLFNILFTEAGLLMKLSLFPFFRYKCKERVAAWFFWYPPGKVFELVSPASHIRLWWLWKGGHRSVGTASLSPAFLPPGTEPARARGRRGGKKKKKELFFWWEARKINRQFEYSNQSCWQLSFPWNVCCLCVSAFGIFASLFARLPHRRSRFSFPVYIFFEINVP